MVINVRDILVLYVGQSVITDDHATLLFLLDVKSTVLSVDCEFFCYTNLNVFLGTLCVERLSKRMCFVKTDRWMLGVFFGGGKSGLFLSMSQKYDRMFF